MSDTNLEEGTFKGLASMFGVVVDSWIPTIIERGAWAKSLLEDRERVKVLWQHETWNPIGVPTAMAETMDGLEVAAKISQTTLGRDALLLIRDGVCSELSVGFDPIRTEERRNEDNREITRHILEARLWEFSVVTFGADKFAKIQAVHAAARHAISADTFAPFLRSLLTDCDPELPAVGLAALTALLRETHEGKVLSGKNRTLVSDALAALQALLDAAEPKKKDDDTDALSRSADADEQRAIAARVAHHLRTLDLDVLESGASFALTS